MALHRPAFQAAGNATTVNLGVTASSQRVQFQVLGGTYGPRANRNCRIYNSSATVIVFVEFGDVTVVAAVATGIPIGPGQTVILDAPWPYVAAIGSAAGPSTVYFTPGEGGYS